MRQLKVLAVVLIMSLGLFAADSPFSGTWKLNLAKSKMTPPVPKSDIAVVDADENGLKLNEDVITDKGEALKISYEAKFDGKDYPVTGDPSSDSVSTASKGREPNRGRMCLVSWSPCSARNFCSAELRSVIFQNSIRIHWRERFFGGNQQ